jgi:hypothetical protein
MLFFYFAGFIEFIGGDISAACIAFAPPRLSDRRGQRKLPPLLVLRRA